MYQPHPCHFICIADSECVLEGHGDVCEPYALWLTYHFKVAPKSQNVGEEHVYNVAIQVHLEKETCGIRCPS